MGEKGAAPDLSGSELRIAVVVSRFNEDVSKRLLRGALGALAFGIGATEMANAWLTGDVRVKVPATCRVDLRGRLPAGVEAKAANALTDASSSVGLRLVRSMRPRSRRAREISSAIPHRG